MLKYILFAVILAAAFSAGAVEEYRLEVLGGRCVYGKVGNYVWYNDLYAHNLDMNAGCGLVAVSKVSRNLGDMHLGWRLAYVDMGTATVNAIFPMRDEDQAAGIKLDGSGCTGSGHGCLGHGRGAQKAHGFSLSALIEHDALGLEGGVFVYEGAFRMDIEPVQPSKLGFMSFDFKGWQATPFIGLSARYGYLMAMVRVYGRIKAAEHGCGGCSGVANGTAYQAMIGLQKVF